MKRWLRSPLFIVFIFLIQLFVVVIFLQNDHHDWSEFIDHVDGNTTSSLLHPATVKKHFSIKQLHSVKRQKIYIYKHINNRFNDNITTTTTTFSSIGTLFNKLPHRNPFHDDHHQLDYKRPELSDIVRDSKNNIILQDIQFLLDFAIIGFAKVRRLIYKNFITQE
jgi:hypothetical protein